MILFGDLVGAWRFELQTSCAQGSCKKSILLVRLALFYVMVHGFGPDLAAFGHKLDPSYGHAVFSRASRPRFRTPVALSIRTGPRIESCS